MGLKKIRPLKKSEYSNFDQLNGDHPFMHLLPDGCVLYKVRKLNKGKVGYFNFLLAKEMGLIAEDHPHHMTYELEKTLVDTFALQIINEFDELNVAKIDPKDILPHEYMATRYLQIQHKDKTGKTSGDGRGIWNGVVDHKGKTWDVSSRGTGVTKLAPGAVVANKPLETGNDDHGYGCGRAEIDELYAAAIMAEAMYLQGVNTERVLCVVDFEDGFGIGVRAAKNLIRPAHMFLYLRQNRYEELKKITDYTIQRHNRNEKSKLKNYDDFLNYITTSFANFSARLDVNYIFTWMEWDGDNILVDAGIIDYGSIRQFGIRHDLYRYDDIERFSTNLNEQKKKARMIVQTFIQLCDYLKHKEKKSFKHFDNHPLLKKFDHHFTQVQADLILYRLGLTKSQRNQIRNQKPALVKEFLQTFQALESEKIFSTYIEVGDGINKPALFNMKKFARIMPEFFLEGKTITDHQLFDIIRSKFSHKQDFSRKQKNFATLNKIIHSYQKIIDYTYRKDKKNLQKLIERADFINRDNILTGNAVVEVVDEMLKNHRKKRLVPSIQAHIDHLALSYAKTPEVHYTHKHQEAWEKKNLKQPSARMVYLVKKHCEDI